MVKFSLALRVQVLLLASLCGTAVLSQQLTTTVAGATTQTNAGEIPVIVAGVVPDESTRQAILARVRDVYGAKRVVDRLGVGITSAPPQWAEYVNKLVASDLSGVSQGHLRVAGNAVELVGSVDSIAAKERVGARLVGSLNPTYTVNNQLQVTESTQSRIENFLDGKVIEFELGSAVLTPSGRLILDELLPILRTSENKKIQIVGHTDASGSRTSNLLLSQERAAAVRSYLASKGVAAANMQVFGVGPDKPIASNNTLEGQTKNRRIEFKVVP